MATLLFLMLFSLFVQFIRWMLEMLDLSSGSLKILLIIPISLFIFQLRDLLSTRVQDAIQLVCGVLNFNLNTFFFFHFLPPFSSSLFFPSFLFFSFLPSFLFFLSLPFSFLPSSFPFPFHVKRFLCLGNAQTFAKEISKGFADS